MSDANPRRISPGGIFVAVVIVGSAVAAVGWYAISNRTGPAIDASGFDLSSAPQSRPAANATAAAASGPADSSLSMLKGDAEIRIGNATPAQEAAPLDKKEQAHDGFKEQARKHEADVRRFAERMTRKYPLIRQYGRDWMSHPDLRKLNDDYMRDRDPIAFLMGLAKAPSLGAMVKKYAGAPEIAAFVTQGLKEAPGDLTSSALAVLSSDGVAKKLISNVAAGLGLPPSVSGLINGGAAVDQRRVVSDIMNSPAARSAMRQQGQQPPPVPLSNNQR